MNHIRTTEFDKPYCTTASLSFVLIALVLFVVVIFQPMGRAQAQQLGLSSPHSVLKLDFTLDASGASTYRVLADGKDLLFPSRVGLSPNLSEGFTLVSSVRTEHRGQWHPLYGERDTMPDNYNQLTVRLKQAGSQELAIEFRAYDEGIALRYGTDRAITVSSDRIEFHLPASSYAYEEHGTEGEYAHNPISAIAHGCQTPLTIELGNGGYAAILEAASVDFPQMTVAAAPPQADTLIAELGGPGQLAAGAFTPWRMVMFAKTPGELLEHNYLQLDLNAPQALSDTSWIKPGLAMRDVTLSNAGARAIIDFAQKHHIAYVGFDDGWYGSIDYDKGDATHERTADRQGNPAPPLSIRETVEYGKQHGVGVWVYIDHKQAEKQRDILFPLYEHWGLAGVKIGFVDVGTQEDTAWLTETIRKAAEHHLMLDIHDSYRTTGYTRTYPNLVTVEGIRGNEHFPTPEHNATLPFTRYLAGSADYTICYYTQRLVNTTHAHQLAMSVVSYSPLQWVFWYDSAADYHGEPEIDWFERLPTVWNETRVPMGEIGKYAVIARRSGSEWYVGVVGDSKGRTLSIQFNFLAAGTSYMASIYTDDTSVQTATHVAILHRRISSTDVLSLTLPPSGGAAIRLIPEK
jgi:alpha-glucosidase